MKQEYITPFIKSVNELFSMMLGSEAKAGTARRIKDENTEPVDDIVGLIGLSGFVKGTVVMVFPIKAAKSMVGQLLGTEIHQMEDTLSDGVAELVNIVAGGAKAMIRQGNKPPIYLSLPTVIRGNGFKVNHHSSEVWLEVPFTSDFGRFSLRVTLKLQESSDNA